ncbi:hypothetical protein Tco_0101014, partial [Tanacetum coccineum]
MVAYLEKSEGNVEFHEIIDFLKRSSIHHALTVSPIVSTTFVEQFWTSAKSKTINNVRHITAKVAGNSKITSWDQIPTNIATAVICLTSNQKYSFSKLIFDGMLRHLDAKKKFVMYPRFISIFLDNHLANVLVPLDHFPINALTSKVFSFMVKNGKHFSRKVTPLFACMLVHSTEDEGVPSERQSEEQPIPSPRPSEPHTSELPIGQQPDPSPAHTSEVPMEQQTVPSPRPSPSTIIPDSIRDSS